MHSRRPGHQRWVGSTMFCLGSRKCHRWNSARR
ncbi:hypothetical protein LINPERPRIM_LOCUS14892 [Linum perenne]